MGHNNQKKIAIINDVSGFGRCSIAVSLPVISHMGVQGCPLPTSVFSNHTGFESFYYRDFTDYMQKYIDEWKKLGLHFDGITSGFLGSVKQIDIVRQFINDFKDDGTKVVIDPVMGENGRTYSTYTQEMCMEMRKLVAYADVLTPNVTEACILTDMPYKQTGWSRDELTELTYRLKEMGAKAVVISGIIMGSYLANAVCGTDGEFKILRQKCVGRTRSGTGDIFSAIIAADCVNGVSLETSVRKAAGFIRECILATEAKNIPLTDGVCFEEVIHRLR